jgi:cobalt-zinc-cadmium efflux system protein
MVDSSANDQAHRVASGGEEIERRLLWAIVITVGIFVMEMAGGFMANSLALKSDAGHLFGDILALGVSLGATRLSRRPPTAKRTYGYLRIEVFAAVFNAAVLFLLAGYIFYEAYQRLMNPVPVRSIMMLVIAIIGLAANMIVIARLRGLAGANINVRAAFLHILGDMLGSVGVVAGGIIMLLTGNFVADPIISFFVGGIIIFGAVGVLRDGANILLEGVPRSVDYGRLKDELEVIEGVVAVHDLHIWTISSDKVALSAHLLVNNQSTHSSQRILQAAHELLKDNYDIRHSTLQVECECCADGDCGCHSPASLSGPAA